MGVLQKEREASKNIAFTITHPKGILLEAAITKRDIDAYNRGKIDEQTFHDRIIFREHKPQPARDKTIDIMADILTNILKKDTDLRFLSGTQCTGFYQKGIGALFLVSQKPSLLHFEPKNLDTLKAAVIETLADLRSHPARLITRGIHHCSRQPHRAEPLQNRPQRQNHRY